jgi:Trypsin
MRIAAVLTVFVCGACAPTPVGRTSDRIQGGTTDTTDKSVVAVFNASTDGLGSGVLLAPNLVATARHAVAQVLGGQQISCGTSSFGSVSAATDLYVTTASPIDTSKLSTFRQAAQIIVPTDPSYCGNDIALIILPQNLQIASYAVPTLQPPMTDHTLYGYVDAAIGYGEDSTTGGQGTRRIKSNVPIECITYDSDPSHDCTKVINGWQGYIAAGEFLTGDGVCPGDSGGPAFDQASLNDGMPVVFGVLSRGAIQGSTCVTGIYTRLDSNAALIVETAQTAAMLGGYPVPAWAQLDGDAGNDAAVKTDSGTDAGTTTEGGPSDDAGPPSDSTPSSGCQTSGTPRSSKTVALLVLMALACQRRRLS